MINIPFTFVDKTLCPLDQVSIETLKLINLLKKQDNEVSFINMRSKKKFSWKKRKAGLNSQKELQMSICSRSQSYLKKELKGLTSRPHEIMIVCNFSFSPYIFDEDIIRSIIRICKHIFPDTKIKIGGDFIDLFPNFADCFNLERFVIDQSKLDLYMPDTSCLKKEKYGLFQLTKGCYNRCSFCVAGKTSPRKLDADTAVSYMQEAYEKYGIKEFWNWDPNILLFSEHFEEFVGKYSKSGIMATLNFALGFQPDLIKDSLIKKLSKIEIGVLTIPFETGTSSSYKKIMKPYTIICSIKNLFKINRYAKRSIKRVQSSFIIGYPHDDMSSIFRIYLSILRMKSIPRPFPLYTFPGTKEYQANKEKFERKSITELHGQLWPLIKEAKIQEYQNLLKFLLIDNLEDAKRNLRLLSEEMKVIFLEELKINEYFVDMCLAAENENLEELKKIEQKLERYKKRKENVLYVSVSPKSADRSISKKLGEYFLANYKKHNPDSAIRHIELCKEPIEFINEEYVEFIAHKKKLENLSDKTKKQVELTSKYIKLLRYADKIVISTPMYTLSIPAILKAFFELIASRLFYELNDCLSKKKVCCILTRDGKYDSKSPQINVQEKSILAALDFIGIGKNVDFICAEGFFIKPNKIKIINNAKKQIKDYITRF